MGKQLNQRILNTGENYEHLIAITSKSLQEKFSKFFNEKQMSAMMKFNEHFRDVDLAIRISHELTWEEILNLILAKRSATDKRVRVKEIAKSDENTKPVVEIIKEGNATIQITTRYIQDNDKNKSRDILKNQYFMNFISNI